MRKDLSLDNTFNISMITKFDNNKVDIATLISKKSILSKLFIVKSSYS